MTESIVNALVFSTGIVLIACATGIVFRWLDELAVKWIDKEKVAQEDDASESN